MAFRRELYSNAQGEIDLRKEFDAFLFGTDGGTPHNHLILLRQPKRDSNNQPLRCACVDHLTNEPSSEQECPFCLGEGFYWKESFHRVYSNYSGSGTGLSARNQTMPMGTVRVDYKIFYLKFDVPITYKDKIIDLKLDTAGNLVVPYRRESIYKPETIIKNRSDNGRVEYITVYCREDNAIRLDD